MYFCVFVFHLVLWPVVFVFERHYRNLSAVCLYPIHSFYCTSFSPYCCCSFHLLFTVLLTTPPSSKFDVPVPGRFDYDRFEKIPTFQHHTKRNVQLTKGNFFTWLRSVLLLLITQIHANLLLPTNTQKASNLCNRPYVPKKLQNGQCCRHTVQEKNLQLVHLTNEHKTG